MTRRGRRTTQRTQVKTLKVKKTPVPPWTSSSIICHLIMKDCASRSIHLYSFSTCLNSDPHFSYSFWLCFLSGYATGIERRVDYATSCWLEPVGALPPRRAVLFAETPEVHGFGLGNDLPIVSSGSSSSGFATRYQKIPPPPSSNHTNSYVCAKQRKTNILLL